MDPQQHSPPWSSPRHRSPLRRPRAPLPRSAAKTTNQRVLPRLDPSVVPSDPPPGPPTQVCSAPLPRSVRPLIGSTPEQPPLGLL
uniref:Predicted protein n=1 Tax=Hordeum vulgare subsp. vulgare TaxID=112509 RepID=F2CWE9_HORVV|nr:predicted protein [Hordeum vulgare subsp. vulgare]